MSEGKELLLSEEDQLKLTVKLHREGLFGIREDPDNFITLKSKRLSPHYLDIRPGISEVDTRELVVGTLHDLVHLRAIQKGYASPEEAYHHFAGTPEAMTSYAAMLAQKARMSLLQPRVDLAKATGNKTPILGRFSEGDTVAEFDDVVTDGKSKIDTIAGLQKADLVVADYFVVVDREEGGAPQVKAETGLDITPALGASSMVIMLYAESLISTTQRDNVAEYMEQYGDSHAKAAFATAT